MTTEPRTIPPVAILCGGCGAAIDVDPYMLDTPLACVHCDTPIDVDLYEDLIDARRAIAAERKAAKQAEREAAREAKRAAEAEAVTLAYAGPPVNQRSNKRPGVKIPLIIAAVSIAAVFVLPVAAGAGTTEVSAVLVIGLGIIGFIAAATLIVMRLVPLPIENAKARNHPSRDAIAVMTWLGIVLPFLWIAALIWSLSIPMPAQEAPQHHGGEA